MYNILRNKEEREYLRICFRSVEGKKVIDRIKEHLLTTTNYIRAEDGMMSAVETAFRLGQEFALKELIRMVETKEKESKNVINE
jgi:hypothetical protein